MYKTLRNFTGLYLSSMLPHPTMKKTNNDNVLAFHHQSICIKMISINVIAYFSKLINSHYLPF